MDFFLIAHCLVYLELSTFYLLLPTASGNTAVADIPFSLCLLGAFHFLMTLKEAQDRGV